MKYNPATCKVSAVITTAVNLAMCICYPLAAPAFGWFLLCGIIALFISFSPK